MYIVDGEPQARSSAKVTADGDDVSLDRLDEQLDIDFATAERIHLEAMLPYEALADTGNNNHAPLPPDAAPPKKSWWQRLFS